MAALGMTEGWALNKEVYTTASAGSGGSRCSSEPKRRSSGHITDTTATVTNVITPPNTTDGTSPRKLAATPDSNSPSSLLEPMKMTLTAVTRPRIESGVRSCNTVCRITTLMLSAAPKTNRAVNDTANDVVTPKIIVAMPNIMTVIKMVRPPR